MIKSNELRLGNWVNFGVLTVPIKSIYTESVLEDKTSVYVKLNDKLSNYCLDIKDISPIPLTEEILLKIGFRKIGSNEYYLDKFMIECFSDGFYFTGGEGVRFGDSIEYLHQLQNMYYALHKEELEVKFKM